jgi:hypothetical protein
MKLGTFVRIWAATALLLTVGIEAFQALHGFSDEAVGVRLVVGLYLSAGASMLAAVVVGLLAIVFHKSKV